MSSRDGRVEAGLGTDPWDDLARPGISGPPSESSAGLYGAGLSLDEAQDIAARRLRELAIRLGDDDSEGDDEQAGDDSAPFDADRHFRFRLAERIAGLDGKRNEDGEAMELAPPRYEPAYAVTEALPLSAFGDKLAELARSPAWLIADRGAGQASFLEHAGDALDSVQVENEEAAEEAVVVHREPLAEIDLGRAMRLADLIQEQRALLDRLSDISAGTTDARPLRNGVPARSTLASLAQSPASDAELLFDAGTHPAEPVTHDDHPNEAVPAAISAEQLIAALDTVQVPLAVADFTDDGETKREKAARKQSEGATRQEPPAYAGSDRSPMIIERARAELRALANGEISPSRSPSPVVGFVAGLSLSVVIGIGLYFAL